MITRVVQCPDCQVRYETGGVTHRCAIVTIALKTAIAELEASLVTLQRAIANLREAGAATAADDLEIVATTILEELAMQLVAFKARTDG